MSDQLPAVPDYFWRWLFELADRDVLPRYERADRQAEYGIHYLEFLDMYQEDAVLDAKEYYQKLTSERQHELLKKFLEHLLDEEDGIASMCKQMHEVLNG